MQYRLKINGAEHVVDVDEDTPLLWVLRDVLGMTGTKFGCGMALCGACTVHVGGQAMRSCVLPVASVGDATITTIEAIGDSVVGHQVQQAWIEQDVPQCGYCQSGQIMAATALLSVQPQPTDTEISQAMAGNVCRCGTYGRIRSAIKIASRELSRKGSKA